MADSAPKLAFGRAFKVWWAYSWRWPLLMLAPAVPLALLLGVGLGAAGKQPEEAKSVIMLLLWPLSFWAQIETFRRLPRLAFKDFSIKIEEKTRE